MNKSMSDLSLSHLCHQVALQHLGNAPLINTRVTALTIAHIFEPVYDEKPDSCHPFAFESIELVVSIKVVGPDIIGPGSTRASGLSGSSKIFHIIIDIRISIFWLYRRDMPIREGF